MNNLHSIMCQQSQGNSQHASVGRLSKRKSVVDSVSVPRPLNLRLAHRLDRRTDGEREECFTLITTCTICESMLSLRHDQDVEDRPKSKM